MTFWLTSDQHDLHHNIIKPDYCNRPFKDVYHQREVFLENINSMVKEDDWLFFLGDLSMNPHRGAEFMSRVICKNRVLVAGNHDRCWEGSKKWVIFYKDKCGFTQVHTRGEFPRLIFRWDNGIDYTALHIRLSHLPYDVYDGRYTEWVPVEDGTGIDMLCHGHSHSKPGKREKVAKNGIWCYDVGVDANDYKPVSEHQIVERFVNRNG